ncbi:MAG: hypothetical protein HC807_06410 [Gammaproteobacteria bacterium]|nr:hypothetical protein [Gammaproteobacteria bacterium]
MQASTRSRTSRINSVIPATVKIVLPLGPVVVYEAETRTGESVKISIQREGDMRLLAPGTAIFIEPAAPDAVRLFQRTTHSS